jgi:hypothetical protein
MNSKSDKIQHDAADLRSLSHRPRQHHHALRARAAQPARGAPPDAVKLKDDQFVKVKSGDVVNMKAVSW